MPIFSYDEYLDYTDALFIEDMMTMHNEMLEEVDEDEDAKELYEELVRTAYQYSVFRAQWYLFSQEERISKDPSRTACHDSLIVKFNQLARYLKMQGKEAVWRERLGDNRKCIGDFGCYITFIDALNSR